MCEVVLARQASTTRRLKRDRTDGHDDDDDGDEDDAQARSLGAVYAARACVSSAHTGRREHGT